MKTTYSGAQTAVMAGCWVIGGVMAIIGSVTGTLMMLLSAILFAVYYKNLDTH